MVFYSEHEMSSRTTAITELDAKLASSLETFGRLYDERAELLSTTLDKYVTTVTSLCQDLRFAVVKLGKAFGCLLGAFSGGIYGTASALVWSDSSAEDVTLGVVGGILGGVAGGALGGVVGVAVTVSWELSRHPVYDVGKDTAWLFGFAAGGVAGGAIGGPVGATGGVLGGVLGALWAVKYANHLHRNIIRFGVENYQREKTRLDQPTHHANSRHLRDFWEAVKPLLDQLKHTQLICGKMASCQHTHAIASQTAASLDSAAKMEVAIELARRTSSPLELIFYMAAGAELSRNVNKELEEMRKGAERFLHQLRGDPEDLVRN